MAGTDLIYEIPANIKTPGGELQNTKFWMLQENPTTLLEGLPWYDSVNHVPKYYDGTSVREFGRVYTQGTGIAISAQNVISVNLSATDIPSLASNKITAMTGYTIASATAAISTSDSLNTAIGKLEYHLNHLSTSDIPDLSGTYLLASLKGANNGVASLGADGKVPSSQLPAYVDDVIELLTMGSEPSTCATGDKYYNTTSKKIFTATGTNTWGTTGVTPVKDVIYVRIDTNGSYRWTGSDMINIANPIGAATESAAGIAEIATSSEVSAGTDDTRIVTPSKLAAYYQKKLAEGTGITILSNTISVTDYANLLHNTATGTNSLTLLGTATSSSSAINIGYNSSISGNGIRSGERSIVIGANAKVNGADDAIQIGGGTNATSCTLRIGFFGIGQNWELLDGETGLIPDNRISSTIKNGAAAGATAVQKYVVQNTAITVTNNVGSIAITHGLGTDDVSVTVIRNSDHKVLFPVWSSNSGVVTIDFISTANIPANTYTIIVMG